MLLPLEYFYRTANMQQKLGILQQKPISINRQLSEAFQLRIITAVTLRETIVPSSSFHH